MLIIPLAGLFCAYYSFSKPLARLSYDLPFLIERQLPPPRVVLIYLDEGSARALHQPPNDVWDRNLHVQLLDRLHREGASLVYYDVVFLSPWRDAEVDENFAHVMHEHGHVILGASFDRVIQGDTLATAVFPPAESLKAAAAGWGLVTFKYDPDFAIRELYTQMEETPTASVLAAQAVAGSPVVLGDELGRDRWLNYYGPAGTFPSVSFYQALLPDGVPPGFFKDAWVFIGGRPQTGALPLGKEVFANPYSRWGHQPTTGLEVHATEFSNLVQRTWLTRLAPEAEAGLIVLYGLAIGWLATFVVPSRGIPGMFLIATVAMTSAYVLFHSFHLWYGWMIPVGVQLPLGIVWSTGTQYFVEAKRRAVLRRAFSFYLSGHMADRIAESDFDLTPGGKLVDASVMFSDCQGFSAIAEELGDPLQLSHLLIEYFTKTSECVLAHDGTIVKYIGDGIMAIWGAPLAQPDHAYEAAYAAWQLSEVAKVAVMGRVLTTRVGLCSGEMAAGNLGSAFRFDYTVIGDAVNLAARLEGMNKLLGTSLLASESTRTRLGDRFITRCVGHFVPAGKRVGAPIYELLCPTAEPTENHEWVPTFDDALKSLHQGKFEQAESYFREVIWMRGGKDGPSEFYLRHLRELADAGELATWTGVVVLKDK